jgi:hypothetical protein
MNSVDLMGRGHGLQRRQSRGNRAWDKIISEILLFAFVFLSSPSGLITCT